MWMIASGVGGDGRLGWGKVVWDVGEQGVRYRKWHSIRCEVFTRVQDAY